MVILTLSIFVSNSQIVFVEIIFGLPLNIADGLIVVDIPPSDGNAFIILAIPSISDLAINLVMRL